MNYLEIPITFENKGKTYTGSFDEVPGTGASYHFHLTIDGYHKGQLWYAEHFGWQYGGNSFEDLQDYFGMYVQGWLC